MKLNLENLPSDSVFLQQIIIDLVGEITSLKEQLKLLKAKRFGKSSEKLDKQIAQLELWIEESEIEDADEAQLDVTRQNGETQAHNLVVGDYILIRGSDSVPSIDGIHRVTRVDPNNIRRFYIDQYIEKTGHTGNIYPLRKMRFSTYAALEADRQTKVNGIYKIYLLVGRMLA